MFFARLFLKVRTPGMRGPPRHPASNVFLSKEVWSRAPVHPLISASGAAGRLFIDIFSGLFLFLGFVAARFTTPVEDFSVTTFNLLHWHLHLHSLRRRIHFAETNFVGIEQRGYDDSRLSGGGTLKLQRSPRNIPSDVALSIS